MALINGTCLMGLLYTTIDASQHQYCFSLNLELVVLAPTLSPTLSREKHHHTIKAPSAGEGADRGEIKNLCSIQD
jgi:hypothetical protein